MACLISGLALLQLFLGPDLGLADNGDGRRVLCGAGLQPPPTASAFTEVVFELGPLNDPAAGLCGNAELRYSTSQIVLVDAVRLVDGLFSDPGIDLRAVGAVVAVLLGSGFGFLYLALGGGATARLMTICAAAAMMLDVAYLHYASSAFSESAGFLGLVWTTAALAWMGRRRLALGPLLALFGAATVMVTAKSQLTALAVLVLGAVSLCALQNHRSGSGRRRRPLVLAALFILGLTAGCGLQLSYQGPEFHRANMHNLVLFTVAPLSGDPAGALTDMGLDPGLAQYAGTNAFSPDMAGDPDYGNSLAEADRADVVRYLFAHPDVAWTMLETGVDESTHPRTTYLAELTTADREGGSPQADRWSPGSDLLQWLAPAAWPMLPFVWLALVAWGLVLSVRRTIRGHDMRSWGYALTFVAVAAPAQVVTALIGDGFYELAKHEVFVSHLIWLALALALGSLVRVTRRPSSVSAEDPVSTDGSAYAARSGGEVQPNTATAEHTAPPTRED